MLTHTRTLGYAEEVGLVTPGLASVAVAVAVLDHTGHPVAGVAVTFPVPDDPGLPLIDGVAAVRICAQEMSRRLGYRRNEDRH